MNKHYKLTPCQPKQSYTTSSRRGRQLHSPVKLFETLNWLDTHLANSRYLAGDTVTEADWRLLTTLLRFDSVYVQHFKCNRNRLVDLHHLWGYVRELYQWPGVADTVNLEHIVRHYHYSHNSINPHRIIPINPVINWLQPHKRG